MKNIDINSFKQGDHDCAIDLIRGIAIIMVFFVHYGQTFGNPFITRFGQMGCQMFIFVSGYTCCFSMKRWSIWNFYKKRFLSIAYGFYTALFAIVVVNFTCEIAIHRAVIGGEKMDFVSVLCNFLLIHGLLPFCNNNVFPGGWFIGTIVILYLLHPALLKLYCRIERKWLLTVGLTIGMIVLTEFVNYLLTGNWVVNNNSFSYFLFSSVMPCYLLGIHMYFSEKQWKKRDAVIGCIITMSLSIIVFYGSFDISFIMVQVFFGLFSYFFYLSIKGYKGKSKMGEIIQRLGADSFYIYLTHATVVGAIARVIKKALNTVGIKNDIVLFFLLIIPCVAIIWCLVWILKRFVETEKKLLTLVSVSASR